jgi:Fe-S-cluster formation regulator IscX/YfhJ
MQHPSFALFEYIDDPTACDAKKVENILARWILLFW